MRPRASNASTSGIHSRRWIPGRPSGGTVHKPVSQAGEIGSRGAKGPYALLGLAVRHTGHDRMAPVDTRGRGRTYASPRTGGLPLREGDDDGAARAHGKTPGRGATLTRNHARSPVIDSVRIGVKATSGGLRRDREPVELGRRVPPPWSGLTRDGVVLLYTTMVPGPVSAVGAAREGMDSGADGEKLTLFPAARRRRSAFSVFSSRK